MPLAALSPLIPHAFTSDPAVVSRVTAGLLVLAVMQLPGAIAFALDGALIGANDERFLARAAIVNLLAFLPLALVTARNPGLGMVGLWGAQLRVDHDAGPREHGQVALAALAAVAQRGRDGDVTRPVGWHDGVMPAVPPELARYDADVAAGRTASIDPAAASRAIDDLLHGAVAEVAPGPETWTGSVHLHCTDVDGEWLVVGEPGQPPVVTREHAKGACALRGPAADLLLALWRRVGLDRVDVVGDADLADRFVAATELP